MKKAFTMPKIVVEQFVPNEYVSACGDENKVYKFTCDAAGGSGVYQETNGREGLQRLASSLNPDTPLAVTYHYCGETHEAKTTDAFVRGYVVVPFGGSDTVQEVIIWKGPNGDNVHCTTQLNMETWETAKS